MEEGADVNRDTAWSLATLVVAAIVIAFLLLWVTSAPAKERPTVCLTHREARQLWPRIHLYWYSEYHCWSNRRGPPRGLKFDPVFSKAHAEENPRGVGQGTAILGHSQGPDRTAQEKRPGPKSPVIKIVKAEDFTELDAAADADTFFNAKPFPYRQYVLNLDLYKSTYWHRQIWGLVHERK